MPDMGQLTLGSAQHGNEHVGLKITQHTDPNTGPRPESWQKVTQKRLQPTEINKLFTILYISLKIRFSQSVPLSFNFMGPAFVAHDSNWKLNSIFNHTETALKRLFSHYSTAVVYKSNATVLFVQFWSTLELPKGNANHVGIALPKNR